MILNFARYKKRFDLLENEEILHVARVHGIFFFFSLFIPVFFLVLGIFFLIFSKFALFGIFVGGIFIFFSFVAFIKVVDDFFFDVIVITDKRVIKRDCHLFGHSDNTCDYEVIANIKPHHKGIFPVMFRYGSITIETTSAVQGELVSHRIKHHHKVAKLIEENKQKHFEAKKSVFASAP